MISFLAALAFASATPLWVVIQPVANMYSQPSADSDVVTQAIYGVGVQSVEESGDWVRIRTPDDYTGWAAKSALLAQREGGRPYASQGRVAQVSSLFANLYREPSVTEHQPILTVPYETRLEVIAEPDDEERRWIQVRLADDRAAWIQRGDAAFDAPLLAIGELIALSRRFLGLPYLWGGTSTFGYDCSGFTQMLCRRRGVVIPRDAAPQARWDGFAEVSRDQLAAGDLLYFGDTPDKITHTGMYIGNGEFIHATAHKRPMVQVSRLEEPYWTERFLAARRLK